MALLLAQGCDKCVRLQPLDRYLRESAQERAGAPEQENRRELETVEGQRVSCKWSKEAAVPLTGMEGQQKVACCSHPALGGAMYFEYLTV